MAKILVVDDNKDWTRLLDQLLTGAGHEVAIANDGYAGLKELADFEPELVILDISMPVLDGFDVLRRMRARSDVLVLGLSVHGRVEAKAIRMLELGADDIIAKSVCAEEIRVRVDSLLRRPQHLSAAPLSLMYDDGTLTIDVESDMTVTKNGQEVGLTPTERKLLRALLERRDEIVPHNVLLEEVWSGIYADQTTYLAVYIRYLRKKIELDPKHPHYLVTKHRQGYGFFSGPHERNKKVAAS